MPVELRKRPAPEEDAAPAAKRSASKPRATSKAKQVVEKAKSIVTGETSTETADADASTSKTSKKTPETSTTTTDAEPSAAKAEEATAAAAAAAATTPLSETSVGKALPSTALSTPTTTHTGDTSTLSSLLTASTSGIVIFTYPKASTPGCTTQACLFRDNYDAIRAKGYEVYGLSNDSEKANTGFKTKQNLQYVMLCDPDAKLTGVLGMKKPGNMTGTLRGVVVLGKDGDVRVWFQGGPPKTVDAVKTFVGL